MNKKIISISVVSLLLLLGASAFTSAKLVKSTDSEDEWQGDLEVNTNSINLDLAQGEIFSIEIIISNIGDETLEWKFTVLANIDEAYNDNDWDVTSDDPSYNQIDDPKDESQLPDVAPGGSVTLTLTSKDGIDFGQYEVQSGRFHIINTNSGIYSEDYEEINFRADKPKSMSKPSIRPAFTNIIKILSIEFPNILRLL